MPQIGECAYVVSTACQWRRPGGTIAGPRISTVARQCPQRCRHQYGIVIQMFWQDHPPPHFHALYAEHEALIDIQTLNVIQGGLPRRALASCA